MEVMENSVYTVFSNTLNCVSKNSDRNPNVVFSPLNLCQSLAFLLLGANEASRKVLRTVMGLDNENEIDFEKMSALLAEMQMVDTDDKSLEDDDRRVIFSCGLAYFIRKGKAFREEFVKNAHSFFGAEKFDFDGGDVTQLQQRLDEFVSKTTAGMLTESSLNITQNTSFGCVYASYFLADWKKKFKPKYTRDGPFLNHFQILTTVPMMVSENYPVWIGYSWCGNFRRIDIPYAKSFQLSIITKNDDLATGTHISEIASVLSCRSFMDKIIMVKKRVELHLPKFDCRSAVNVMEVIRDVNKDANIELDLSNAIEGPFESHGFQHIAAISTDENGTEAAFSTSSSYFDCAQKKQTEKVQTPFGILICRQSEPSIPLIGGVIGQV